VPDKESKIDFVYNYLKERKEIIEKRKKTNKFIGKILAIVLILAVMILLSYAGIKLMLSSLDMMELIKSDDIKILFISLATFIIGYSFLAFFIFNGLRSFYA